MNIYDTFEAPELVAGGKWFPLSADSSICLQYMGSDSAKRSYENLMRPYAQRTKLGLELTEEEAKAVNTEFLSKTLILSWKGIKGKDNEVIEFTQDAAAALCDALPRFAALVLRIATDEANFEKELVVAEVGNSSNTSDGASGQ